LRGDYTPDFSPKTAIARFSVQAYFLTLQIEKTRLSLYGRGMMGIVENLKDAAKLAKKIR
jgi:hypothetical protein